MDGKGHGQGSHGQFPNYPQGNDAAPMGSFGQSTQYGGVYHQPNSGYLPLQNYQPVASQYQPGTGFQQTRTDPIQVYTKRKEGLTKLRNVGVFNISLAVITSVVGVAILIVASGNIGFPVFNFGVLLVGILHFFVGVLCYLAGKNGLNSIVETDLTIPSSIKCYIVGQFALSVALITFAILAAVFAFLSGAVCAGAEINFQSRNNNEVRDLNVQQYCDPNNDANAALAFVGGTLCVIIGIMSIYGSAWLCCYGTLFGWNRTYGGRITFASM